VALVAATTSLACGTRANDATEACCVATFVIDGIRLPTGTDAAETLPLGGISDLCFRPSASTAGRLWAITDRGPNGQVKTPSGSRRSLLAPGFSPCLIELEVAPVRGACYARPEPPKPAGPVRLGVESVLPLRTRSGRPTSGRPTGGGLESPIVDHVSGTPLPPDSDGIDSEAVAALADGTFWIAEEYGPSLVHVAADGRMLARLVPAGGNAAGADAEVSPVLPAAYARRRDNRGFEALAALDGDRLLVALLQSPLEKGDDLAGSRVDDVPLLLVDAATARPVAEHVYRAGDPAAESRSTTRGRAGDDVKLCAMTAAGGGLLVIEQCDNRSALLYAVDLAGATNTLPLRCGDGGSTREEPDPEACVVPVSKRLVADVGPLVPRLRAEARLGADDPLKLEGLALLDERHVALVNDDDFGVHAGAADSPRSCLWVVRLAEPVGRSATDSVPR